MFLFSDTNGPPRNLLRLWQLCKPSLSVEHVHARCKSDTYVLTVVLNFADLKFECFRRVYFAALVCSILDVDRE